jgi:hypothetical protein
MEVSIGLRSGDQQRCQREDEAIEESVEAICVVTVRAWPRLSGHWKIRHVSRVVLCRSFPYRIFLRRPG